MSDDDDHEIFFFEKRMLWLVSDLEKKKSRNDESHGAQVEVPGKKSHVTECAQKFVLYLLLENHTNCLLYTSPSPRD